MTLINELNKKSAGKSPEEIIKLAYEKFGSKLCFSSSMGVEDQVITHVICSVNPKIKIFTLDTGRLFPEAYDLIDRTSVKYKITIDIAFPSSKEVEKMVHEKGINLFYDSVENRKECCEIRKVKSLTKKLKNFDAWISGIRKEQSDYRSKINVFEWDEKNGLVKVNPLIDWTEQQVYTYVEKNNIPVNPLHFKGYKSIGCQPCTRAIEKDEDFRAGRWWWESGHKECGLHIMENIKLKK
ncbi:MAG: phosphoadenosine phosphosulfate reductase [Bacteroidetes bacterium GWF2_38_335]|nr:MAG: phosphoadenosine phosphosulfate reductase [Bacteroidetes bacterium GWF2_38_335]OFY81832.1 MAG: phosphoadenosine phosphosulfate reductase [Bacteroidetes bacterium RIFOXYA12_FULL_38_20]HBS87905.1 phosphoadenylyl-sulfate reductase [Bacteroidales bacterium]